MQTTKDNIEKLQTGLDDLRYRRKNKTVEHCFTSMCFFYNTWLRGVTPLDAYTRTHIDTHSLVKPCVIFHLCVEMFEHTLSSSPRHSAYSLLLAVVSGC